MYKRNVPLIVAGLSGHKELLRVLDQLPKSLTEKAVQAAGKKALVPVRDAAAATLRSRSSDSGELADSMTISTRLSKRQRRLNKGLIAVHAGPSYPSGAHGHLVERGTRERWTKRKTWFGTRYRGRMTPEPFLRPAWDAHQGKVLQIMQRELWGIIQAAVRRLRKSAERGKVSARLRRELGGG